MLNVLRRSKERRRWPPGFTPPWSTRAREPEFFARFGVQDTLDGRFDLVDPACLAGAGAVEAAGAPLCRRLSSTRFSSASTRRCVNWAAGDIGMGRRMKKLADAFYGRMQAYGEAKDEAAMEEALVRNLYRGAPDAGGAERWRAMCWARRRGSSGCDVEMA